MAKWELDCTAENQGPRPGEIRGINYIDGMDDQGNWIVRHRIEQFWDGTWTPIKVYHEEGDELREVKQ
jgi:hypothetical protein